MSHHSVTLAEAQALLEAMYERYGYDLRGYSPESIRRRLRAALAQTGLPDCAALQRWVLGDPASFAWLLDHIIIQVSQMFRDPEFYRALRTQVVPHLRTYPRLNIWHSGCAGGEEVYASAIVLREAGLADRTQIYATDLLPQALREAEAGLYSAAQAEVFARNYQLGGGTGEFADYSTRAYGGIAMNPQLRNNVLFFQHNLVTDHPFGEMNVVFCRNVLIYFGKALRQQVLKKLHQSVCPGGFLCLGSSEGVTRDDGFVEFVAGHRIFRRVEDPL